MTQQKFPFSIEPTAEGILNFDFVSLIFDMLLRNEPNLDSPFSNFYFPLNNLPKAIHNFAFSPFPFSFFAKRTQIQKAESWRLGADLRNKPNLISKFSILTSKFRNPQLRNEPKLSRRGYVEYRHPVHPRGIKASRACRNEANFPRRGYVGLRHPMHSRGVGIPDVRLLVWWL